MQYELTTLGAAGERETADGVGSGGEKVNVRPCTRLPVAVVASHCILFALEPLSLAGKQLLSLSLFHSLSVSLSIVLMLLLLLFLCFYYSQFVCILLVVVVGLENWQRVRSFEYPEVDFFKFFSFIYVIVVCICSVSV